MVPASVIREVLLKSVFVESAARDGAFNMALDGYLLGLAASGEIDYACRVYSWLPACVSFGRLQTPGREADLDSLVEAGTDIIRRPTGGRAVWHESEITYSVIAGAGHPLSSGTLSDSLAATGAALLEALAEFGVEAALCPAGLPGPGPRIAGNPCFTSHGRSEIAVAGRKLVGSAQARSGGAFLEHGSILLRNDQLKLLPFLKTRGEDREEMESRLADGTCCLYEILPELDVHGLEKALARSLEALGGTASEEFRMEPRHAAGLGEMVEKKRLEALGWLARRI
jgi:lipoate-protein ligase A